MPVNTAADLNLNVFHHQRVNDSQCRPEWMDISQHKPVNTDTTKK